MGRVVSSLLPVILLAFALPALPAEAAEVVGIEHFGGTVWAADSGRWEAVPGGVWTFESGAGSHFDHSAPGVDPFKGPSFHAYMEGWVGVDLTRDVRPYFRRLGATDFTAEGVPPCVGSSAGLGGAYSFWAGVLPSEAGQLCYASMGYGNDWNLCLHREFTYNGTGSVNLAYDYLLETEDGFDYVYVLADTSGGGPYAAFELLRHTGSAQSSVIWTLDQGSGLPYGPGPVDIMFCVRTDETHSDEDGFAPTTCGAFAVDDITVTGGGINHSADFESGDDGWALGPDAAGPGGEWSRLAAVADLPAVPDSLMPCGLEDSVLVFFDPAGNDHPYYQRNMALSPWIDLERAGRVGSSALGVELGGYFNLPVTDYVWVEVGAQWYPDTCALSGAVRMSDIATDGAYHHFGGAPICGDFVHRIDLSDVVNPNATQMRIAVGVVNVCRYGWDCTGLSNHTPWIDNISLSIQWPGTLQDMIDAAAPGDTVLVEPGVYSGDGNRDLTFRGKNIVLLSSGGPEHTVIDCGGDGHRGFIFRDGEDQTAVVEGFTITGGDLVSANKDGGGIAILDSSPTIRGCILEGNRARNGGGLAVYGDYQTEPLILDCIIRENEAEEGGGIHAANYHTVLPVIEVRGGELSANHALSRGGGLYGWALHVEELLVAANTALAEGGGAYLLARCLVTNSVFADNEATASGGGLYGRGVNVSGSTLRGNHADLDGGGGVLGFGFVGDVRLAATLDSCDVSENTSAGEGGGLFLYPEATVTRSRVRGNTAIVGGGVAGAGWWSDLPEAGSRRGVAAGDGTRAPAIPDPSIPPPPHVVGTVISGNVADVGGGVAVSDPEVPGPPEVTLLLTGTTVSANLGVSGGAFYLPPGKPGVPPAPDTFFSIRAAETIAWGNDAVCCYPLVGFSDANGIVTFTCCALDSAKITGPGTVAFDGPQVFDNPVFCDPEPASHAPTIAGNYTLASVSPCLPGVSPCALPIGALEEGCTAVGVPSPGPVLPSRLLAYPNPFSRAVSIAYAVPPPDVPVIRIFDISGRLVRTLLAGASEGGVTWDGREESGRVTPAGIYFIQLSHREGKNTQRVVKLR